MDKIDRQEQQFLFKFRDVETPFASLSDGYKAFVGWIGELVSHLADATAGFKPLTDTPGIVLVDEIDLHLHPEWQRQVIPAIASVFPKLQFVFTTHSPLIASTVQHQNLFVTDVSDDKTATIKQIGESSYGRSVEQILLSSYFGLTSTRPQSFQAESQQLFLRAAEGDSAAAIQYLTKLAAPVEKTSTDIARVEAARMSTKKR